MPRDRPALGEPSKGPIGIVPGSRSGRLAGGRGGPRLLLSEIHIWGSPRRKGRPPLFLIILLRFLPPASSIRSGPSSTSLRARPPLFSLAPSSPALEAAPAASSLLLLLPPPFTLLIGICDSCGFRPWRRRRSANASASVPASALGHLVPLPWHERAKSRSRKRNMRRQWRWTLEQERAALGGTPGHGQLIHVCCGLNAVARWPVAVKRARSPGRNTRCLTAHSHPLRHTRIERGRGQHSGPSTP